MPTLRRILKYTPAVVLGLLVAAWAASAIGLSCIKGSFGQQGFAILWVPGSVNFCAVERPLALEGAWLYAPHSTYDLSNFLGQFSCISRQPLSNCQLYLLIPFAMLATATLPLAIGPFISFRFRLWHYLAYTALVAVELAYYLQWQE